MEPSAPHIVCRRAGATLCYLLLLSCLLLSTASPGNHHTTHSRVGHHAKVLGSGHMRQPWGTAGGAMKRQQQEGLLTTTTTTTTTTCDDAAALALRPSTPADVCEEDVEVAISAAVGPALIAGGQAAFARLTQLGATGLLGKALAALVVGFGAYQLIKGLFFRKRRSTTTAAQVEAPGGASGGGSVVGADMRLIGYRGVEKPQGDATKDAAVAIVSVGMGKAKGGAYGSRGAGKTSSSNNNHNNNNNNNNNSHRRKKSQAASSSSSSSSYPTSYDTYRHHSNVTTTTTTTSSTYLSAPFFKSSSSLLGAVLLGIDGSSSSSSGSTTSVTASPAQLTLVTAILLILLYSTCLRLVRRKAAASGSSSSKKANKGASGSPLSRQFYQHEQEPEAAQEEQQQPDPSADLRAELESRGLTASLNKQHRDLEKLQDIYKKGGYYVSIFIEATGERMLLIDYLETALMTYHKTWDQVIAICDEYKEKNEHVSPSDPLYKDSVMIPYDDELQLERIAFLDLMLQHLPKLKPAWWQWATNQSRAKALDDLIERLAKEYHQRVQLREAVKPDTDDQQGRRAAREGGEGRRGRGGRGEKDATVRR